MLCPKWRRLLAPLLRKVEGAAISNVGIDRCPHPGALLASGEEERVER